MNEPRLTVLTGEPTSSDWLTDSLTNWFRAILKFTIYLLVNSPLVSSNSLIFILSTPYVYEPKPSSQVWLSKGQLPISNWQLALNVAGPRHILIPLLSTDTSVTNFVRPPANATLSSALKPRRGFNNNVSKVSPVICLLAFTLWTKVSKDVLRLFSVSFLFTVRPELEIQGVVVRYNNSFSVSNFRKGPRPILLERFGTQCRYLFLYPCT